MNPSIQLWCAFPDDLIPENVARLCEGTLNDDEITRLRTFRLKQHQLEFLTTRALVRIALSHQSSIPAKVWRFSANEFGKPEAQPECGLQFNLSNCLRFVVCAITKQQQVGVDAESLDRGCEIGGLAGTVFSELERQQFAHLPFSEQSERAVTLWTLKEAYIKARGKGLSLPLQKFSFVFEETGSIRLEIDPSLGDRPDRWQFCLLNHAQHKIALVAERMETPLLEMLEVRPVTGIPRLLPGCGVQWYPRKE